MNTEPKFDEIYSIHITELAALEYPKDGYEYRGLIHANDDKGSLLREQILQTRRKPEWLVNIRHQGTGALYITLQFRRDDTQPWQGTDQMALHSQLPASDQRSTDIYLPLRNWVDTPDTQLKIRLTTDQSESLTNPPTRMTQLRNQETNFSNLDISACPFFARPSVPVPALEPQVVLVAEELSELTPLTAPEQVLVKDVWNKFLAFQDMLIEMFFERLLHEEPELIDQFGYAVDLVPGYFAELFDVSVRKLRPHTERILREGYRGVYPEPQQGYKTVEDYTALLANLGMRTHHWLTARRVWTWVLLQIPGLEDYDRENLTKGVHSAPYRFFTIHLLTPALAATKQYAEALTPEMISRMRRSGEQMVADARATGIDFYRILFQMHPEIVPYFGRTDVDSLAEHLMQSIAFLVRSLETGRDFLQELRDLSRVHTNFGIPPEAYIKLAEPLLTVMRQRVTDFSPEQEQAWRILLNRVNQVLQQPMLNQQQLLSQAKEFIDLISQELAWETADCERRWNEIEREVRATGTYTHTYEELAYGAQVAWRNSAKCIGRISWRNMIVRDVRHVSNPDEMFRECVEHLRIATNGGNVQIVMNVFRPKKPMERWGPRIWNAQYIRFAAYEQADGTILGDKANLSLTQTLIDQGWTPPASKTAYDCLPLAIEVPGQSPRLYEFAADDILMVPLEHPAHPQFKALDLQWCAIPAIANFRMEVGGIQYGCCPFNGWFMETEIARNLWEEGRYDKAETIARAMGQDTSSEQTLWRDRAFVELNAAVLHSFSKAKVTLVDHQTAARQFLTHDQREKRAGRECPAQWSWVVPSAGGSSTPVWHHEMRDFFLSPSYHYAADKWSVVGSELVIAGEQSTAATSRSAPDRLTQPAERMQPAPPARRILILYGSETGTAESYARQTARRLNRYQPRVMALNEYDTTQLNQDQLILVVTSTFRDGDLPGNATNFFARLQAQPTGAFSTLNFSVMALGSTIYPQFCAAGAKIDRELARIGGNRVVTMHQGDEIKGQANTFRQWLELVARLLGEDPTSTDMSATDEVRLQASFLTADQVPASGITDEASTNRPLPVISVPVVANRELLKEVILGSRSTRFVAFDITNTDATYETGDHVAIYPHNPPALVQWLCELVDVDPDAWFTTSLVNRNGVTIQGDHAYPRPVNVRQVLTEDLDLSLREPFNELILLLKQVDTAPDKERLDTWAEILNRGTEDNDCLVLKKYIADNFTTVADLLAAFPSAKLSFAQLIELLPRQKPRLYSISSCSLVHPNQIHITVGVVHLVTDTGQTRLGLCSNYLASLDPTQGAHVRLAVRTSNFRPPRDPKAPMLMVGPGTGLSPLVGFLQHREVQLRALRDVQRRYFNTHPATGHELTNRSPILAGHTRLFFGCRNLNDYLYQQELETWHEAGVLTHLDVAFSRMGEDQIYVQHLIGRQSKDLWEILSQADCHYYICGDAKMADEVFDVLMTIAKTTGGLSHAEAVDFFQTMQRENRFLMDVWGVLLNFRQAMAEVQEVRYSQGERWLGRLTNEELPL